MFRWMCIVSEMVWCTSFFCLGAGDAQKNNSFCVHTQNFCGVLRWGEGWRWNRSESWLLFGEVW